MLSDWMDEDQQEKITKAGLDGLLPFIHSASSYEWYYRCEGILGNKQPKECFKQTVAMTSELIWASFDEDMTLEFF